MISLLLEWTQGCVGCLKIKNFMLKMNLVVCSANIASTLNELQKIANTCIKKASFLGGFSNVTIA